MCGNVCVYFLCFGRLVDSRNFEIRVLSSIIPAFFSYWTDYFADCSELLYVMLMNCAAKLQSSFEAFLGITFICILWMVCFRFGYE